MEYRKIKLLQGTLVVPNDFVVVEQTKTDSTNYAGVVAEKNGTVPHYVVLSDKPISDFSIEDEDRLYATLGAIYPEVEKIRKQEIEAVFEDGMVVNADEWKAAPRLGMFPICEVQNINQLYFGTGILREED